MSKILGVDHIVTSCKNIKIVPEKFNDSEYSIMFIEYGLHSTEEKKPYLKKFTVNHDAIFLKSKNALAIEAIDHNSEPLKSIGPYKVLLKNKLFLEEKNPKNNTITNIVEKAFEFPVNLERISEFNLSYYNHNEKLYDGLSAVIIECENLSKCTNFWENAIGFKIVKNVNEKISWCLMEFSGIVPSMTIKLLLIETKTRKEKSFLDFSGWTCLSFIVTDINSSLKKVKKFGANDIGKPYAMKIGGNNIMLSFFRGPEGELVEFLELKK